MKKLLSLIMSLYLLLFDLNVCRAMDSNIVLLPANVNTSSVKSPRYRYHFTPEEDQLLISLVAIFGPKWTKIALYMKGRTARQCRDRYNTYLSPILNQQPWSDEEIEFMMYLYKNERMSYTKIAKRMPHRTPVQIKAKIHQVVDQNMKNSILHELERISQMRMYNMLHDTDDNYDPYNINIINNNSTVRSVMLESLRTNSGSLLINNINK